MGFTYSNKLFGGTGSGVGLPSGALTAGRVVLAAGPDSITDDADLTFDGTKLTTKQLSINDGTATLFSTYKGANSDGNNVWIGGGGQSSVGEAGATYKGSYNNAIGVDALHDNTTGHLNNAIGVDALKFNTTGAYNNAIGSSALKLNTTGYYNNALCVDALSNNTTGFSNNAIGVSALKFNTTGAYNNAIGVDALYGNTTGYFNIAIGVSALYDLNITANDGSGSNTAVGHNTGRGIVTGVNNTILGANVTGLASNLSNNVIIADGAGNRRINVDSSGNVLIGTTTSTGPKLEVNGDVGLTGFIALSEMTAPAAPAANGARLFVEDNGSGKSRLVVIFASGATQVLATEP